MNSYECIINELLQGIEAAIEAEGIDEYVLADAIKNLRKLHAKYYEKYAGNDKRNAILDGLKQFHFGQVKLFIRAYGHYVGDEKNAYLKDIVDALPYAKLDNILSQISRTLEINKEKEASCQNI